MDIASGLAKGGSHGAAINREKPSESVLLKAISYDDPDMLMPPAGKLPQQVIDDIRTWIEQGAVDPRTDAASDITPARKREMEAANHWAFQPLPILAKSTATTAIPSGTIDAIINTKLQAKGITPNASATQPELIRRLAYDLTGLHPTWDQFQAWSKQPATSYESWVDQLLASPQFGERMARRWMDVARYADNKGYVFQEDREYANGYRYRDWLIESFNNDMPFDQFASYQIAADRMDPGPDSKNLNAMGFLTLGRRFLNNENDIADDRIDVITRGFLGLSVACARCHDHKFDAIGMDDYYSLHAALVSGTEPKDEPGPLRLIDSENIRLAVIYKRGNPGLRGDVVPKQFIKFMTSVSRPMETGSGRIDMAQAIADKNNPLTARVFVNRMWGWLMGAHLVDTPSDLGIRSTPPVQRELIDRLAAEFIADGWSVKRLIKRIVLSDAYRRSSSIQPESFSADPENMLWWRANRKRMDFESLRDSVLVATNLLDRTIGGPSIKLVDPPFATRRTLYAYIDRQNLPGVFRSFDFASPDTHVPYRFSTTVPQQGLFMMNSPLMDHFATEYAKKLVEGVSLPDSPSPELVSQKANEMITTLFHSVVLRDPTDAQRERSFAYLQTNASGEMDFRKWCWADLAKALLCTNEFSFVD
jgi:hypothetical protein